MSASTHLINIARPLMTRIQSGLVTRRKTSMLQYRKKGGRIDIAPFASLYHDPQAVVLARIEKVNERGSYHRCVNERDQRVTRPTLTRLVLTT